MADSSPLAHSPTLVSTPRPAGERLEQGAAAGEYVVESFLGAGAMGEVYAGVHPVIGKKVAIKVLRRDVGASPEGAERFKREARAVNQVDHPSVIDIFSFGRLEDGRLFLVMDLVEGRSLRKALADGALDVDTALDVLGAVADALDAAHARGVVHRDLKPDNVMLGTGAPPKVFVLDFGLAKLVTAADGVTPVSMLTGQGTWLGTPSYMAPEQWSADGAGPASDRYSLGVMAFELLSGRLPFEATSLPQMMEQHFRAKVPALSARGASAATSRFDPVLARALAKDPTARFGKAREMVDALRAAMGTSARTRGTGAAHASWLPAVAGAAVLALSVGGVLLVRGSRDRGSGAPAAHENDPPRVAPTALATVRMVIQSAPPNAEVIRDDGRAIGMTPTELDAAPGTRVSFRVRMPGYLTIEHTSTVLAESTTLPMFVLSPVTGFEGVWALPGGELRAFKRTDDGRVEVSKLRTVDGEREFYRHYSLVAADDGVEFMTTETVINLKAPNEPSCHLPQRVVYHFEPTTETLVLRREAIRSDLVGGKCIVKSAAFDAPLALTRVDVPSSTETLSLPPVGKPVQPVAQKKRPPTPVPAKKSFAAKARQSQAPSELPANYGTRPANVLNTPGDLVPNAEPQAQNAPAQQAPRPTLTKDTTGNARGDSQISPAVDVPQQAQKQKK